MTPEQFTQLIREIHIISFWRASQINIDIQYSRNETQFMKLTYRHKPKSIRGAKDLIKFVSGIPAQFWCVDVRDDGAGHYCVLGHLDKAYNTHSFDTPTDGFTANELATANNGTIVCSWGERLPGAKLDGESIKARVLKFLKANINRK